MILERIIRVTGFQPTNYPKTSFDGDSVSRYYSAMSGTPTPHPLATLRALVRPYPSALVGYSGGVDSARLAVVLPRSWGRAGALTGGGRGRGGGGAVATRRVRAQEDGGAACRARARASAMGCAGGALPFEPRGLRHPDHVAASRAGGARGGVPARARRDGGPAGSPPR